MSTAGAVGFIGLGNMGFGMARNLVVKGYDVLAYDLATEPLERLVAQGARRAENLAQIGQSCERVMVMVVNGAQVEAVISGDNGLLQTMSGGVIMVCSTIALSELRRVAAQAEARGVQVLDCPVSGGVVGAAEGTLTILSGGDAAVFEAQRPLLDAVASHVTHLGPLGAGLIGKLANNLILGVGRLAIAEAFAMAKKAGLSTEALYQTMTTCTADSKQLRSLEGAILRGEYPPATFHGLKDLSAAIDSGHTVAQAMPITSLAREFYQLIDDKLGGLNGSNEVMRYYLDD
jgi:3-hydroxyisobutyrate dehydrogenase-like beta-hydroxyacid dehydrogenase